MSSSLALLILVAVVLAPSVATNFSDCATKLNTLETALYETGDNLFELNRIYFPPSTRTSRFIRVIYTFLDEQNEIEEACNASYVWAIGSYLFFQPPTVFQYNSLFFNYPNNDLTDLPLTLPYECRPLIESDGVCSCRRDSRQLDVLTQQLNIYARFTVQSNVQRENTFARAVCSDDLYDIYYSGNDSAFVFSILSATIVLPLIAVIIFMVSVRRLSGDAVSSLTKPSNHDNIVAVSFVGAVVTIFIIVIDIFACSVVANDKHEYSREVQRGSINLYIIYVTLSFNIIFAIPLVLCLLYLVYINVIRFFGCETRCLCRQFLRCCCRVFLGKVTLRNIEELSDDEAIAVLFPIVYATPLLCFSSHVGYIMLAWVTEPGKATSSLILYYAILIYLFLAFRKLYRLHSRIKLSISLTCNKNDEEMPGKSRNEVIGLDEIPVDLKPGKKRFDASVEDGRPSQPDGVSKKISRSCCTLSSVKADKDYINPQALCLLIFYSVFVVGIAVFIISIFLLLPISSAQLISYLFNAIELVVVFITTYLAFKLIFASNFSLKETFESFRAYFTKTSDVQERDAKQTLTSIAKDEKIAVEIATGAIAAEFAHLAVHGMELRT